ncbi:L-fucose kinase-like [Mya arenaria]|uniref:L-fucose kinase-like n=1 Tax=Mya arenaria TaxID=6604 RepID=UPI0022E6A925|nr:L-fucose kinase-like [Mya arenaria]
MTSKVKWTAVVITCPRKEWSLILQRELEFRQIKGYIDKDVFLLTVEDPKQDVGSGGATINALLTVAEYISAQRGFTVLTTDILKDARILILHNGRGYAYDSCGRPFTGLPVKMCGLDHEGIVSMVDLIVKLITEKIGVHSGAGVWVSSLDMILSLPNNEAVLWEKCDVCAITVPSSLTYCRQHGVYKLDSQAERSEDRCNKSVMELDGAKYTASFWEKSKQLSEQAAAIFGLTLLRKEDGRKPDVTSPNDDVADAWSRHFRSRDIHV